MAVTLLTLAKLPWKLITAVAQWVWGLATAPRELRKLKQSAAASTDPRPICTVCGAGRVSVAAYDDGGSNRVVPRTTGGCNNSACSAKWRLSSDGRKLHTLDNG